MKEFLKSVVEHYLPKVQSSGGNVDCLGLADYLFVFPNRRSGLFFNQYLYEKISTPIFAPKMTTISELYDLLNSGSQIRVPDRIELLFALYNCYKKTSNSNESFDNFLYWGELLLADFNDADKYLVDVSMLFENIKNLREIDDKFFGLTEEQIKVIRTFWTNFNPETRSQGKELFRETWQILYELYVSFKGTLLSNNLAYEGLLQRMVVDDLREKSSLLNYEEEKSRLQKLLGEKVVFVGLTALSKTDIEVMRHLNTYRMAEFCWDYADDRLNDKESHASFFKSSTIDVFPNVLDDEELKAGIVALENKSFEVIEVPSGVGQTEQAANKLKTLIKEGINPIKTAVILPDEKMLLPMLYSIPKEFEPFNVTMGYSLKATTIATFIDNLAQLQANRQKVSGVDTFYYKNVLPLLGTNYLLQLSDGRAEEIMQDIVSKNLFRVPVALFKSNVFLKRVFKPCENQEDCVEYLNDIFEYLSIQANKEISEKEEFEKNTREDLFGDIKQQERRQGIFTDVEIEFLYTYKSLVSSLDDKIKQSHIEINTSTYFSLLRKLAQSETVAFTGEPLSGLQVMGVLETRGLDFDNLIILSMNEGVLPAKPVTNSFVPMSLRNAFGMPTQMHRDAVYAYHFYRLISRAKNVVMIYDSRSDGMQTGEPSRYIKQLSYLYDVDIKNTSVQYNISVEEDYSLSVAKDNRVMSLLNRCLSGNGNINMSATALKHYIACPLQFYYEFVEGLREDDEVEESIDDRVFGLILHDSIQEIYDCVKGRKVTSADLDRVISDKEYLGRVIRKHFFDRMKIKEITGYLSLVEGMILQYVIDILEHDKTLGDFIYIDSEYKKTYEYPVQDADGKVVLTINLKAIYDRLDKLADNTLRIVDYKTGRSTSNNKSKLLVPNVENIFDEDSDCSNEAFQVLLYSLLIKLNGLEGMDFAVISPNLYFVRDFHPNIGLSTELRYNTDVKRPIKNFMELADDFKKSFDKVILEIFDPTKDFNQTDNSDNCKICSFKEICKRNQKNLV